MTTGLQSVRDLKIWQKSMDPVEECYQLSARLPSEERFGLTSQICRATTSVPANIAEGFGRWNAGNFARFLAMASGSPRELETHLVIIQRLDYAQNVTVESTLHSTDELSKMLYAMRRRVLANIKAVELADQARRNQSSKLV